MSGDMIKDFDACHLCLHQAEDPLACTRGHLFCKGCIYECLLRQKEFQKTQTKLWNEQREAEQAEEAGKADKQNEKELERFHQLESGILSRGHSSKAPKSSSPAPKDPSSRVLTGYNSVTNNSGEQVFVVDQQLVDKVMGVKNVNQLSASEQELRRRALPSFWVPSLTPDQVETKVKAPPQHTGCPAGSHILKLKNLIPVKFMLVDKAEKRKKGDSTRGRYMCGGCRKTFTNSSKLYILKKCGHVACKTCVDTLIKKDKCCVECSKKVRVPKDIIELESGGRSFAAHGAKIAKSYGMLPTARLTPKA